VNFWIVSNFPRTKVANGLLCIQKFSPHFHSSRGIFGLAKQLLIFAEGTYRVTITLQTFICELRGSCLDHEKWPLWLMFPFFSSVPPWNSGVNVDWATTASFQVISSSSFTSYPAVVWLHCWLLSLWDTLLVTQFVSYIVGYSVCELHCWLLGLWVTLFVTRFVSYIVSYSVCELHCELHCYSVCELHCELHCYSVLVTLWVTLLVYELHCELHC